MLKALNKTTKQCPKCGFSCDYKADLIGEYFGWRMIAGLRFNKRKVHNELQSLPI